MNKFIWEAGDFVVVENTIKSDSVREGGPGSGNWEHEGRPGERGGSGPSAGGAGIQSDILNSPALVKIAGMIRNSNVEVCITYDKTGKPVLIKSGGSKGVDFSKAELEIMRGSELSVHNHPDCNSPFSRDDINFARIEEIREVIVVTPDFQFHVTPVDGHTWPEQDRVNKLVGLTGMQNHRDKDKFDFQVRTAQARSTKAAEKVYNYYQRQLWKEAAPKLGLIYKQEHK